MPLRKEPPAFALLKVIKGEALLATKFQVVETSTPNLPKQTKQNGEVSVAWYGVFILGPTVQYPASVQRKINAIHSPKA